jgi:hypothetical protein
LKLASGERVSARSIVIASGVNYRRLAVENLDAYEGASVHYWATRIEARLCAKQEVFGLEIGTTAAPVLLKRNLFLSLIKRNRDLFLSSIISTRTTRLPRRRLCR